jgi:hypothetical protein
MIQNPAGKRNPTQTDDVLTSIRDALGILQTPTVQGGPTYLVGLVWYIGDHARFTALPNGVKLEILQDSSGNWIEQSRWTE